MRSRSCSTGRTGRSTRAPALGAGRRWPTSGELVAFETFGDATDDTRYVVFSATKAFVAGRVGADRRRTGRRRPSTSSRTSRSSARTARTSSRVEQVMLHTSGSRRRRWSAPTATRARDASRRFAEVAAELGARHRRSSTTPTSAHWVLAEMIERVTGQDFRDVHRPSGSTTPAGLAAGARRRAAPRPRS